MNICRNCKEGIPYRVLIDGKFRVLNKRKFCLLCSPFGQHNTKTNISKKEKTSKVCPKCNEEKSVKEFSQTNKRIYSYCKVCHNVACKQTIRKKKLKALEYKGNCCEDCKLPATEKNCVVFDFHHTEPEHKDFGIGDALRKAWKNIEKELDKCVLLCSNCHRLRHQEIY
jgi:hypothetical protein